MTASQRVRLDSLIRVACPIHGTSGDPPRIDFTDEATEQQRTAAQQIADSFDRSDAAQVAWDEAQHPERTTLKQQAAQAVTDNNTYLAIASPNAAQNTAQAKKLTQQMNAVIKRLVQLD